MRAFLEILREIRINRSSGKREIVLIILDTSQFSNAPHYTIKLKTYEFVIRGDS